MALFSGSSLSGWLTGLWTGLFVLWGSTNSGNIAFAQVTPDGTLLTTVTSTGNNFAIDNGDRVGNNLFHSFSQFSVPTGGSASFNNARDIQNIFSRVTGGSISNIDGLIQANGTANLFLLNPSGILLGPNASLNIGGSFIGTTANSIQFAGGAEFSALNPTGTLLTLSVPIGLQMGAGSGPLQVQGNGNDGIVPTTNLGIIVSPGQTIALVGSTVNLAGGVITAPAGRIEIGAVANGTVSLTPTPSGWQLGYAQVQDFGDIQLTNRSSLWNPDPIGNPAGGIQVVGRDIQLERSQIAVATADSGPGGAISVQAQRALTLGGIQPNADAPGSWIVNQVAPGGKGNGGDVTIQAGQLTVQDGAAIGTLSLGAGRAGNVHVQADTAIVRGAAPINSPFAFSDIINSQISSLTYASGGGGDIDLAARQVTFTEGGQVVTGGFPGASGAGGNIAVKTQTLVADGLIPASLASSGITAFTLGTGHGGNIDITTDTIRASEGAAIVTLTSRLVGLPGTGYGNAGAVTVTARQSVEIDGFSQFEPTRVTYLGSFTTGAGNAGNVTVTTPRLLVQSGAALSSTTLPTVSFFGDPSQAATLGNSGSLTLLASERIEVLGSNPVTLTSSNVGTSTFGSGNAGASRIQTDQLVVQDGGVISSLTVGTGNAESLTIQANDILVEGQGRFASQISANAPVFDAATRQFYNLPDFPTGNTGTLKIDAKRLTLRQGGTVSVTHEGTGNAGQLVIHAEAVTLNQGQIGAATITGQGGDIALDVRNLLLQRNSTIVATAGGNGNGGNIKIDAPIILGLENSDIIANAIQGRGGKIQITTQGLFGLRFRPQLTSENDITASSQFGINGTVQITRLGIDPNSSFLGLPINLVDPSQQVAQGCAANQDSSFVITGRGGLPLNPMTQTRSDRPWADTRNLSTLRTGAPTVQTPTARTTAPLIQATDWRRNPQTGKVELYAKIGATAVTSTAVATCAGAKP